MLPPTFTTVAVSKQSAERIPLKKLYAKKEEKHGAWLFD
jgi:hypothetical protein